ARPAVEVARFFGGVPIVRLLGIPSSVAFGEPAGQVVRERAQHETSHDAQFAASERSFGALDHFREQALAQRKRLLRLALGRDSFGLRLGLLLFLLPQLVEMDRASFVCAHFHETPFFDAVRMNGGRQMAAETLVGPHLFSLFCFSHDYFDVVVARGKAALARDRVLLEIRTRPGRACRRWVMWASGLGLKPPGSG